MTELEKIGKNLFRLFRDKECNAKKFITHFTQLKKKLDKREEMPLESEYHQQLKAYILQLYNQTCNAETFDDTQLEKIRDAQMSNLNRLQKLKNASSYKKEKHKGKSKEEDWG